jgi:CPA1 family monovalent cation:H+ antiporter
MLSTIWFVLGGLAVALVVRVVADRTNLPAAVLLVLAGLAFGWLPGKTIELEPELILDVVIPPLLYVAARDASLLEIRNNVRLVVSMSVALVAVTAAIVGAGLILVVPGLTFAAALAIGAAVAPPDPVAALAIGRRAGLPSRLMTLIEGEGLLNDATALTIYSLAVTAAVGGGFSWGEGIGRFLLAVVAGVAVGIAVAKVLTALRRFTGDVLVENAMSLATPFLAFALAETIEGSGVLAVVVTGLLLGHHRGQGGSGASRLQIAAVWRIVEYLLEGFVFLLIGQQAPHIISHLDTYDAGTVAAATAITVAVVLLVRPLWLMFVQARTDADRRLTVREVGALSWAGTRGVITLATAFALPVDFPARDLFLFLALVVVLVTLVGQGLTFAAVLRGLHLASDADDGEHVRAEAQAAALDAAIERLEALPIEGALTPERVGQVATALRERRDRLLAHVADETSATAASVADRAAVGRARQELLDAQRDELIRWRDTGRLSDADLRTLERRLDVQELFGI